MLFEFSNITFAFQLPLPREGIQLDYSRWMSNLLTILIPDVMYDERIRDTQMLGDKDSFNTTVKMQVRLAVKNSGDKNWKEYGRKDVLKRTISCRIDKTKVICNGLFNYKILLQFFFSNF